MNIVKNFPNLVLDLDDVLLHEPSKEITKQHEFFSKKSFLVKDSYNHNYIVPAYLSEFLKFATNRFNITFFSSGDGQRNISVVQDIWQKVFNTNKPETVQVLCRKNLTNAEHIKALQPYGGWDWYGNQKKDISKIGELHNTILVDDDKSWVLKGQESNLLKVSHFSGYLFQSILENYGNKDASTRTVEKSLTDKHE